MTEYNGHFLFAPLGFTEFWPRETRQKEIWNESHDPSWEGGIVPFYKKSYSFEHLWAAMTARDEALDNMREEIIRLRDVNKRLRQQMKNTETAAEMLKALDGFITENGSQAATLYQALFSDEAIHLLEAVCLVRTLKEKANESSRLDRLDEGRSIGDEEPAGRS